jgi:protein involved in polysaccharide export with SLBB domain
MKKYLFLCFALLLLATSPVLFSQTTAGGDIQVGAPQSPSTNCTDTDALSNPDAECDQLDSSSPRNTSGVQPGSNSDLQLNRPAGTVSAPWENTPLRGKGIGLTPERPLPPDQPTEFQKFVAATDGQMLPIYGVNLFHNVPSTFSPSDQAPVTQDYLVGPDDELRVRIWGPISYSGNLRVDRSGDIYLPQVGSVHVAGLHFSELDQHLRQAVGRIYRNFDISVDVGRIRSMQIYVTGQARRPGVYTVSSLSSLVDALFASGGPSPQGSLRHILLNRDGKTVADFDLYALLIQGDKSKDVRLLPEDVLFIPAAGPQVAITGSIRVPAIYELRTGETIGDLLEAAGKTTAMSSTTRISMERAGQGQLREAMEFPFDAGSLATPLADGDILRIFPILPEYRKTVTLRGNVANPGRFSWHPGMHLSDLIPDRDSLVSRDYWWKRSHLGLPAPEFEPMISTIGQDPRMPESNAKGFTTSVTSDTLTAALLASGRQGSNDSDRQGGANDSDRQGATDYDRQRTTDSERTDSGASDRQGSYDSSSGTDTRRASGNGSIASGIKQNESSNGDARQPQKNTVRMAAPDIDWDYAVIERLDPEQLKTSLIPFDLGKLVVNHDASQDLQLQPGDSITIFSEGDIRVPLAQQTKYVTLEGEFVHSGVYSAQPGETLRDLVRRAGGLTPKAYLYGADFTRQSTRVLQQQRIDEYARDIAIQSDRGTQALAIVGNTAGATSDVAASRIAAQELSARLSQIRATGRIVLQFQPNSSNIDDVPPISLENGDRFVVPSEPATVNVVGAVYDQNSFLYHPGSAVIHYLRLAGGSNRDADAHHSFVIRADGSVVGRSSMKNQGAWGKSFDNIRLNPGDTLVVPEKTLRPTAIRSFLDWSEMFAQLALGAAAIRDF